MELEAGTGPQKPSVEYVLRLLLVCFDNFT